MTVTGADSPVKNPLRLIVALKLASAAVVPSYTLLVPVALMLLMLNSLLWMVTLLSAVAATRAGWL